MRAAELAGVFGLSGVDTPLLVAAIAASGAWLAAAAAVYFLRSPPHPPVGPRTLELGPEPPALANFLVNDFSVTDEAIPATLIDLAARNIVDVEQRGPGVFYVRLRASLTEESLTAYERRVLEHLRARASDGVVPAGALTTGADAESKRWRRRFDGEVVGDAKARGLSRDALGTRLFTALLAGALIPAGLVAAVWELEAGGVAMVAAGALVTWMRTRHPQRETPDGLEAASRWLGVRAEIEENEAFGMHTPLTVELWDRLLAYGAALGVASGASGPLPMGVESDTQAWSAHGGRWRQVRIAYPRRWPPGWGADPLIALAGGIGAVVLGTAALYWFGPPVLDDLDPLAVLFFGWLLVVPGAAVVVGVALAVMAWRDLSSTVEITGPILRLRTFGDDEKRRYYVAVDDGTSRAIRACRVSPSQFTGLVQGELVTVVSTSNLGCVRSIADATPAEM